MSIVAAGSYSSDFNAVWLVFYFQVLSGAAALGWEVLVVLSGVQTLGGAVAAFT